MHFKNYLVRFKQLLLYRSDRVKSSDQDNLVRECQQFDDQDLPAKNFFQGIVVPDLPDLTVEVEERKEPQTNKIVGRRIIDVNFFLKSLKYLQHDGFGCSFFDIEIISEKRFGLKNVFFTKCNICHTMDKIATESDDNVNINKAAVC